ncbi:MAG: DUF3604 domain-containing protein [Henriciella sp.]
MKRLIQRATTLLSMLFVSLAACSGSTGDEIAADVSIANDLSPSCAAFSDDRNLFWGDLHVHTAYSLDAYGYGTIADPDDAHRFAKGDPLEIDGESIQLREPLDFVAITDHAEWLDLLYLCTDPEQLDDLYCQNLRAQSGRTTGRQVFVDYVIPTITKEEPQANPLCVDQPELCERAWLDNWQRVQDSANQHNAPCEFTTFVGFEWSATPRFSHTHRNVIFASDTVSKEAIDYVRYPTLDDLWEQLDLQCKAEDGCDAITIPHNTNMGDGKTFDVETATSRSLELRVRYERLIEVHQEKGNSECLPPYGTDLVPETGRVDPNADCGFEVDVTLRSQPIAAEDFTELEWEKMRQTYVRGLLLRGLEHRAKHGHSHDNPLKLGIVGATDTHLAAPGYVDEEHFEGTAFSFGDVETTMQRPHWNPGGLTGIWAEENTREALFASLKRREVYATSGPRISLRFSASTDGVEPRCEPGARGDIRMGAEFSSTSVPPVFAMDIDADRTPIASIEIIKGTWLDGSLTETVIPVWRQNDADGQTVCATWKDAAFDKSSPAFWYARVLEEPTPRWSKHMCEATDTCDQFEGADRMIQERAWSSPIWYLP